MKLNPFLLKNWEKWDMTSSLCREHSFAKSMLKIWWKRRAPQNLPTPSSPEFFSGWRITRFMSPPKFFESNGSSTWTTVRRSTWAFSQTMKPGTPIRWHIKSPWISPTRTMCFTKVAMMWPYLSTDCRLSKWNWSAQASKSTKLSIKSTAIAASLSGDCSAISRSLLSPTQHKQSILPTWMNVPRMVRLTKASLNPWSSIGLTRRISESTGSLTSHRIFSQQSSMSPNCLLVTLLSSSLNRSWWSCAPIKSMPLKRQWNASLGAIWTAMSSILLAPERRWPLIN